MTKVSGRSGASAPSGHSPKGGAASASPAKPSVPNAERRAFTVFTDEGAFKIDATCAERMGEFYAFFDKQEDGRTVKSSWVARMFGAPPYRDVTNERRAYRELIRLTSIQRIVVPR